MRGGPSRVGGYAAAFAGSVTQLRSWMVSATGPKVPITDAHVGAVSITTQAEAADMQGVDFTGVVSLPNPGLKLRNFTITPPTGLGISTAYTMINLIGGVDDLTISDFRIDGGMQRAVSGFGGSSFSQRILIQRGEIVGAGNNGGGLFKDSVFRHMYIHDLMPWDEAAFGPYDNDANNLQYPHCDAMQALRGNNTIEECWLENTTAINATSAALAKGDTAEQLIGFYLRRSYIEGGYGYSVHVVAAESGDPVDIEITDNRFSKNYGGYANHGPISHGTVPPGNITITGNVWADDGEPIPTS
jgi:hypothetical protein